MRYFVVFLDGHLLKASTRERALRVQQAFEYGLGETCWIVPYREHYP
jgi:hypothetical protein